MEGDPVSSIQRGSLQLVVFRLLDERIRGWIDPVDRAKGPNKAEIFTTASACQIRHPTLRERSVEPIS